MCSSKVITYSCPGIYVIGQYEENDVVGYASFSVLNYRLTVIKGLDKSTKVYGSVPEVFAGKLVEKACIELASREKIIEGATLIDLALLNWFYGGYIVSAIVNNRLDVIDIEIVNPGVKIAIAESSSSTIPPKLSLSQWIILGYIFRTANWDLLISFCRNNGFARGKTWCIIPGWRNTYMIIYEDSESLTNALEKISYINVYDIIVDNNGLRQVIKV